MPGRTGEIPIFLNRQVSCLDYVCGGGTGGGSERDDGVPSIMIRLTKSRVGIGGGSVTNRAAVSAGEFN